MGKVIKQLSRRIKWNSLVQIANIIEIARGSSRNKKQYIFILQQRTSVYGNCVTFRTQIQYRTASDERESEMGHKKSNEKE